MASSIPDSADSAGVGTGIESEPQPSPPSLSPAPRSAVPLAGTSVAAAPHAAGAGPAGSASAGSCSAAGFGPVVGVGWLADNLDAVVVADVRWYLDGRSGREAYDRGHIPGARFVDLDVDLSAEPTAELGRHPLPDPERFAASMGRLGIGDDTPVVAYDDAGGTIAARMWWLLDSLGQAAAVLDGGIDFWDGPLEVAAPDWKPADFTCRPWPPERFAGIDEVDRLRCNPGTVLVDARSAERFSGVPHPVDRRYGHIPGAVSMPASENLAEGLLRPLEELHARYSSAGADGKPVIAYCGSGVNACHDLLSMRHCGLSGGRLFTGSWSAWSSDDSRPLETA